MGLAWACPVSACGIYISVFDGAKLVYIAAGGKVRYSARDGTAA